MRTLMLWIIIAVFSCSGIRADDGKVTATHIAVSPNNEYIAITRSHAHGDTVAIVDAKTGDVEYDHAAFPAIKVAWAKDATSLAICEHIAGGSQVVVLSRIKSGWVRKEYDPPNIDNAAEGRPRYSVNQMRDTGRVWRISYLTLPQDRSSQSLKFSIVSFSIEHQSGNITGLSEVELSAKAGLRVKTIK